MSTTQKVMVEAQIALPIQKVWDAYNTATDIMQWNSPDPSWHCPSSENDLRIGGKFKNRMEAKDGSFGFDFEGTYDKVVALQGFSYTLSDGRQAITNFTEESGNTKITIWFDPENQNPVDFQKQGWQSILDNFVKYVTNKN